MESHTRRTYSYPVLFVTSYFMVILYPEATTTCSN